MSKIYTKTGDTGTTGLFGGRRVTKSSNRLAAYGTVDELNAWLGLIQAHLTDSADPLLTTMQADVLAIGAHLATPYQADQVPTSLPALPIGTIAQLEQSIDQFEASLPPLKNFILPGGTIAASYTHIARTICRRAERLIVQLSTTDYVAPDIIKYFNRLSDWLFVYARWLNQQQQVADQLWQKS
ncbi:MAG: cob(I)yrinic acid a,c-diamide adenosyltransferase [Candidatus Kerfeldbacteria bacterium]|nr:cob(I)yrinic acid a,c-diamide adenosyltransferase [Candidatus Kerfeldbacteria bacterium]